MDKPVPLYLRCLYWAQWPLWWLAPKSNAFFNAKMRYGKAVAEWLKR